MSVTKLPLFDSLPREIQSFIFQWLISICDPRESMRARLVCSNFAREIHDALIRTSAVVSSKIYLRAPTWLIVDHMTARVRAGKSLARDPSEGGSIFDRPLCAALDGLAEFDGRKRGSPVIRAEYLERLREWLLRGYVSDAAFYRYFREEERFPCLLGDEKVNLLCAAAALGKTDLVRQLLDEGVPPQAEGIFLTPIKCAVASGSRETTNAVLRRLANGRELALAGQYSVLRIAAATGSANVLAELLDHPNYSDPWTCVRSVDFMSAAEHAAEPGHLACIEHLFAKAQRGETRSGDHVWGMTFEQYRRNHLTAIFNAACAAGHLDVVAWALREGHDIDERGSAPPGIGHAARHGRDAAVRYLLRRGAAYDFRTRHAYERANALAMAAHGGYSAVTDTLLAHGVGPEGGAPSPGIGPLTAAVLAGHAHITRLLLARGAKITLAAASASEASAGAAKFGWRLRPVKDEEVKDGEGGETRCAVKLVRAARERGHLPVVRVLEPWLRESSWDQDDVSLYTSADERLEYRSFK